MDTETSNYVKKYSIEIQNMFFLLRKYIFQSVSCEIEEKLWAKLPSYYVNNRFIRVIPFKDHINIEAISILKHQDELKEFKITPKGMLQIYLKQDVPKDILQNIFREALLDIF